MTVLRVTASMDPSMGGPPQGIRNSVGELERLGIRNEVVSCDAPDAAWLGRDSFPIHALGPGKYGFAYTSKLGPWLEENLSRFDAVIVHGLWLWPSVCAARAVRALRRKRKTEMNFSHGLTRIDADGSERLAADRTEGIASCRVTPAFGGECSQSLTNSSHVTRHPSLFVMPHGMLDPWFQRDRSRRVKAVRNWFYWWLVERNVVNFADALLFTCQQELELARTTFGGYEPKREINVGYGIAEPPAFEPEMREAFAARCPGLNGRPYLLFMSRIHAKKGVDLLVRAYARVRAEVAGGELRVKGNNEEKSFSHGLTRISADGSERLAADRTGGNASCRVTPAAGGESRELRNRRDVFPDLVIAGPGWDSGYGSEVRAIIDEVNGGQRSEIGDQRSGTADGEAESARRPLGKPAATKAENCKLNTEHFGHVHAVGMLAGDSKWGALYGCEAFVLPSHQENFGIAVVEALACGKPVLISDQVNIWREIVEDGAGIAEADTEEGVEKLLRSFFERWRAETGTEGRMAADRALMRPNLKPEVGTKPRECYLRRFAIGPAARRLKGAVTSGE